jgi:hypothetical protein
MITRQAAPLALLMALLAANCGGGSSPAGPGAIPTPAPSGVPGATVGPEGGTVTSQDGEAVLVVPAGALASPTALTLQTAPTGLGLDPSMVGSAYALGPVGTRFAAPAELSITYDPNLAPLGAAESDLRVQQLEGTTWRTPPGRVDAGAQRAVASVGEAATYAVRWPEPPPSCGSPAHAEFDFWLGDWDYVVGGRVVGFNQISRANGGCVVHENFNGGQGRSVSFRGVDQAWYQTYIDRNGQRIEMRGRLEGRRMVLYAAPDSRFVWDPVTASRILYFVENSTDGGATWSAAGAANEYVRR